MKIKQKWLLLCGLAASSSGYAQEPLTWDSYKTQVQNADPSLRVLKETETGLVATERLGEQLTDSRIFSQLSLLDDGRPTVNPNAQGNRTQNQTLSLGLQGQTRYGLKWQASQNFSHTAILGTSRAFMPAPDFYDSYPKIDLSLALWKNFKGKETQLEEQQLSAQNKTQRLQTELALRKKWVDAEEVFWQLKSLQDTAAIQADSLSRAEKILGWTRNRVSRNLAEATDLFQAEAAVSARRLELVTTQGQITESSRRLNSLRGLDAGQVTEVLKAPHFDTSLLELKKSEPKIRKDLLIQRELDRNQILTYEAAAEKLKPQLDLSLSALRQGRDDSFGGAQSNMFTKNKNYWLLALNFNMPLDQNKNASFEQGYEALTRAKKAADEASQVDIKLAWGKMIDTGAQLQKQLNILKELESIQKKKADAERQKLNKGRSTTFQVLNFEQDYLNARSQRVTLELKARQFLAQLNQFE